MNWYRLCLSITFRRANATRIALVTFSTEAKVEFNLGDAKVDTLEKAIKTIENATYEGGATASALALEKVREVVVPFARRDSKRVMFFITDGKSNINCFPGKEAKYIREKERFQIYAVGKMQVPPPVLKPIDRYCLCN